MNVHTAQKTQGVVAKPALEGRDKGWWVKTQLAETWRVAATESVRQASQWCVPLPKVQFLWDRYVWGTLLGTELCAAHSPTSKRNRVDSDLHVYPSHLVLTVTSIWHFLPKANEKNNRKMISTNESVINFCAKKKKKKVNILSNNHSLINMLVRSYDASTKMPTPDS